MDQRLFTMEPSGGETKGVCPPPGLEDITDNSQSPYSNKPLPALSRFDNDIIEWMKRDKKFCLEIQKLLDNFVGDCFKSEESIPDVKDTFKRKLIHKLCDMYGISRAVDTKKGVIAIKKTPTTRKPKQSLKEYYNDYCTIKNSVPERKIKIRTREDFLTPGIKHEVKNIEVSEEPSLDLQRNQQQKLFEFNQKNEKYLQIKSKYLRDDDNFEEIFLSETAKSQLLIPNSRLKLTSPSYDPEFIRDPMPAPVMVPQGSWNYNSFNQRTSYLR